MSDYAMWELFMFKQKNINEKSGLAEESPNYFRWCCENCFHPQHSTDHCFGHIPRYMNVYTISIHHPPSRVDRTNNIRLLGQHNKVGISVNELNSTHTKNIERESRMKKNENQNCVTKFFAASHSMARVRVHGWRDCVESNWVDPKQQKNFQHHHVASLISFSSSKSFKSILLVFFAFS